MAQSVRLKWIAKTLSVSYDSLMLSLYLQFGKSQELGFPSRQPPFQRIPRSKICHSSDIQPHGGNVVPTSEMTILSIELQFTSTSRISDDLGGLCAFDTVAKRGYLKTVLFAFDHIARLHLEIP